MTEPLRRRRAEPPHRATDAADPIVGAVAEFANAVSRKLGRGGSPEDQLRSPLEFLVERIGRKYGLDPVPYGEVRLKEIRARPDYAVDVANSRVGYIELKAPGRGIPPNWRPDKREREQWQKLSALPNVIYTDGHNWGRYSYGVPDKPILRLAGATSRARRPPQPTDAALEHLIRKFLLWKPDPPRSLGDLVRIVARLCGLLRDEVAAILVSSPTHPAHEDLTLLASDWRRLLFPDLNNSAFGDAYAQTITFALLLARVNGIALEEIPLHEIGRQLAKKHTLIGKAFSTLTYSDATDELSTIDTLRRVIGAVEWTQLDDGHTNVYAELYEKFLAAYDPARRKESGSYYTPEPVARFMVGFVDQILQDRLERSWGFADDNVVVVDPAMGTGTFLVEVIQRVADTVVATQGTGSRADRLRELFQKRLIGFERQVAPYAVAELRLHQALKVGFDTDIPASDVRFLTNTLENPYQDQLPPTAPYKFIEDSRDEANRIKREARVMVAIGNPPHVGDAKRQGAWLAGKPKSRALRAQDPTQPSIDDFRSSSPEAGKYESDLHAMQWYFWRWALWKVFDAHSDDPAGIVALLSPESFTDGKAFAGMREYLRRTCDEGWIIDLSPEGNRSNAGTRIFGAAVSRRLCIAIFARSGPVQRSRPAVVHHLTLEGSREQKLARLHTIGLADYQWKICPRGWQSQFFPVHNSPWNDYPTLEDLIPWRSRGITAGRTFIFAPEPETLKSRWQEFITSGIAERRELFQEKTTSQLRLGSVVRPLPGFAAHNLPLSVENGECPEPVRVAYRSFDRQWIIPDNRFMERARTALWAVRSDRQIYISENIQAIKSGPGLVFCALIPDIDHFHGSEASAVRPLFRDADANAVNEAPGLRQYLARRLGMEIAPEDLLSYIAACVSHRGYTTRFKNELRQPGIRIPLTAIPELWAEAVSVGREILWLHTFGERCVDLHAGRPRGALDLARLSGVKSHLPIVSRPPGMPKMISYDSASQSLSVGDGVISPVEEAVWEYDVDGMRVVRHWFDYRSIMPLHKKNKTGLDGINVSSWTSRLTDELLAVLAILKGCVDLEPRQLALLSGICDGPLISTPELYQASVLPAPDWAKKAPRMPDLRAASLPGI